MLNGEKIQETWGYLKFTTLKQDLKSIYEYVKKDLKSHYLIIIIIIILNINIIITSQSAITYSKLTTETLEQGVKYVQS